MVFVNSMSDLFHEMVPTDFIQRVFDTMQKASWHTFQVLTKRSERLEEIAGELPWPDNVWMGVSVEDSNHLHRVRDLAKVPAAVRFLSLEPILGPIERLPLSRIHWVIVGGESGPGCRPMDIKWARKIMDQCKQAGTPFFMKQIGGYPNKRSKLEDFPEDLRMREYPMTDAATGAPVIESEK